MFPPKKKPAVTVAIGVGKGKPPMGMKPPKPSMDDLESPDPVEGSPDEEAGESPDDESSEDSGDTEYGAKIESDIDAAGAEMGMEPAHARMAAGKFLSVIGKCLMGGDDGSGQGDGSDTIDTGSAGPGRYGQ